MWPIYVMIRETFILIIKTDKAFYLLLWARSSYIFLLGKTQTHIN